MPDLADAAFNLPPDGGTPQPVPPDHQRARGLFVCGVLAAAAGAMVYFQVKDTLAGGADHQTADWLINYGAGFVRRGLFGELFLNVAPHGTAGLWVLFAIQTSLYFVVFAFGAWALRRHRFSWPMTAVICGPAAWGFFGWDPESGFRKEALAYVALALLVWGLASSRRLPHRVGLSIAALGVFVLAVFSWEASALLTPVFLYLLLERGVAPHGRRAVHQWLAGGFVLSAAAGLALAVAFPGSPDIASGICDTVRQHGYIRPGLCDGAIAAIGDTPSAARGAVAAGFPAYLWYLPLSVLAMLPIATSGWLKTNWPWALGISASLLPLFFIGIDYGRWINMVAVAFAFCLAAGRAQPARSIWTPLVTLVYVCMWGLPHSHPGDIGEAWPWLGLLSTLQSAGWLVARTLAG